MTRRRPTTTRRVQTGDMPTEDDIAQMTYDELVETWAVASERRQAAPPDRWPGPFGARVLTRRLERLAIEDPSLIAVVDRVLQGGNGRPGESGLALAAFRASRVLADEGGVDHVGPFRNLTLPIRTPEPRSKP